MRGQSSFEAIALFATASLILTIFMLYFGTQIGEQAEQREYESLREIAATIRQEVLLARQAGPGYERTITIPPKGAGKEIIFTIRYPDSGPGPTEMTVRFDPPLSEALEASDILGEGVYGTFSGGTNTLRTYEGGIMVEPDPEEIERLLDSGNLEESVLEVEAAFASISGSEVRLSETIECEYGVANEWMLLDPDLIADPAAYHLYAAWILERPGYPHAECSPVYPVLQMGTPVILTSTYMAKGSNLSCRIAVSEDPVDICGSSTTRIAESNQVLIVNSQPVIDVDAVYASPPGGADASASTWTVSLRFTITDPDPYDTSFNVSLIKDGTNANFIECGSTDCVWNGIDPGADTTRSFTITLPVPEGGSCSALDRRLSFKLSAIEADGSSELYTLETAEVTLPCPGGTP